MAEIATKILYIGFFYIKNGDSVFMSFTHVKCTDCGRVYPRKGNLKEMGILDGNNCPNCGGEIILLYNSIK